MSFPIASLDITQSGVKTGQRVVEEARKFALEACIVRIMKARRTLTHSDLVSEIVHQINTFIPTLPAIKTSIAALIEREYLARCGDSGKEYRYLA